MNQPLAFSVIASDVCGRTAVFRSGSGDRAASNAQIGQSPCCDFGCNGLPFGFLVHLVESRGYDFWLTLTNNCKMSPHVLLYNVRPACSQDPQLLIDNVF